MPMDPFQARVAQVALQAAAGRTFALAGSNALIAHGLQTRRDLRRGARHSHLDRTGAAVPEQCAVARGRSGAFGRRLSRTTEPWMM